MGHSVQHRLHCTVLNSFESSIFRVRFTNYPHSSVGHIDYTVGLPYRTTVVIAVARGPDFSVFDLPSMCTREKPAGSLSRASSYRTPYYSIMSVGSVPSSKARHDGDSHCRRPSRSRHTQISTLFRRCRCCCSTRIEIVSNRNWTRNGRRYTGRVVSCV